MLEAYRVPFDVHRWSFWFPCQWFPIWVLRRSRRPELRRQRNWPSPSADNLWPGVRPTWHSAGKRRPRWQCTWPCTCCCPWLSATRSSPIWCPLSSLQEHLIPFISLIFLIISLYHIFLIDLVHLIIHLHYYLSDISNDLFLLFLFYWFYIFNHLF